MVILVLLLLLLSSSSSLFFFFFVCFGFKVSEPNIYFVKHLKWRKEAIHIAVWKWNIAWAAAVSSWLENFPWAVVLVTLWVLQQQASSWRQFRGVGKFSHHTNSLLNIEKRSERKSTHEKKRKLDFIWLCYAAFLLHMFANRKIQYYTYLFTNTPFELFCTVNGLSVILRFARQCIYTRAHVEYYMQVYVKPKTNSNANSSLTNTNARRHTRTHTHTHTDRRANHTLLHRQPRENACT